MIQELEQAPDELVQIMLNFLHRIKATRKSYPLAKFAGILSDSEAEELQQAIALVGLVDPSKVAINNYL